MYRFVSAALAALLVTGCSKSPAPPPLDGQTTTPAAASAADAMPAMGPERRILAVGDSLFAGYGLESQAQSYPATLEKALRARGINARVTNAGVSGDTSGAGAERFAFVLANQPVKPELVIIEFGGNDVLRGLPPEQTRANLKRMLGAARKAGVPVVLMGMIAPPNLGADFKAKFEPIYPELAKEYEAKLVPFVLAGVIDQPGLVQADRIHPNPRGVETMVARTIDTVAGALPPPPPPASPSAG